MGFGIFLVVLISMTVLALIDAFKNSKSTVVPTRTEAQKAERAYVRDYLNNPIVRQLEKQDYLNKIDKL